MKLSLNWLSKYVEVGPFLKDPQKLSDLLTNGGLEVEGITNLGKAFEHVVVGQILEKNKHPNADILTLCLVDVGDGTPRRIVCGAKNHKAGDKIVASLPGAVLPGNFAIKLSKIRGEESQGMLCSEKELGLNTESEGILILPPNAPVGEPFAKYYKLDDIILDVKVTPNRSDCLSHFGLAREIAGLTGEKYEFPLSPFTEGRESTRKLIKLNVEDTERCLRYAGRAVLGVKVGPSPEWLKARLESVGLRSINNVVDITNFVMLEVGQPLHAFDLAKLDGAQIIVRKAKPDEKMTTLMNQELTFDGTELVIADGKKPLALAGVMGGLDSGVTEATKDVFIESAVFQASAVRRASRRHGIESDSSYRFSRGVDPDAVNLALNRACQLLSEIASGTVCSDSYDHYPRPIAKSRIELDLTFISARLGVTLESIEVKRLLERVGCDVSGSGGKLLVNPPPYRADLKLPEDLGEEILRLKGFQNIPESLPQSSSSPTRDDIHYALENRLSESLRALGIDQATNLSLTAEIFQSEFLGPNRGNTTELGLDLTGEAIKILNPINIDLNVLRTSLLPSLSRNVAHNIRHGMSRGSLFEIAPVFWKKDSPDIRDDVRPFYEESHVSLVSWGEDEAQWLKLPQVPQFFKLKGLLEGLVESWQFKSVKFEALKNPPSFLHPGQSARLFIEGKAVGFIGMLHPLILDKLEIKVPVSVCELNLKTFFLGQPKALRIKALPKFPKVERDVAFLASVDAVSSDIRDALVKAGGPTVISCTLFDMYVGGNLPAGQKSLAFRLVYQDPQKTLSDDEVNALHQKAITAVSQKLNLSVR